MKMEIQPTLHVRPDKKGPKNIAILLFISAFLVAGMGYQDWQLHHEGLNDSQIEVFLTTPNSQEGEPTSVEDYRDFEASVQEENGYLIRAVALLFTATCLLVGSVLLHRLQRRGAIICVTGAVTGLIGGVAGSIVINQNAQEYLGEAMKLTYEIWIYLCGSIMGLCLAVAALPLLNARARLALTPSVQLDDSEE